MLESPSYINKQDHAIYRMTDLNIKDLLRCSAENAPSIDKYIVDLGDLKVDPASFESEKESS